LENKTTLRVPEPYVPLLEDIRLLTADQNNPNRTTLKQQEQIWRSLQKYGWAYPIITNKDGVYADGEQRAEVCKQHGEFYAPVLRLPVSDVDRRMLRQILNKLKGKHSKELDNAEYLRILQLGEKDDLKARVIPSLRNQSKSSGYSETRSEVYGELYSKIQNSL
jgi:ParB-like chromosome segregation protein Spo0J